MHNETPFSPLFIAALTATRTKNARWLLPTRLSVHFSSRLSLPQRQTARYCVSIRGLSVRFSSRLSLLRQTNSVLSETPLNFQSAFHSGFHCYFRNRLNEIRVPVLSVLFSSGHTLLLIRDTRIYLQDETFQPAFHRGFHCYIPAPGL